MSACSRCYGTLQTRPDVPKPVNREPCPACLSTPATDEIRQVAREWLGFDLWEDTFAAAGLQWHGYGSYYLPAYLPAGFDLGCRVLARRLAPAPDWDQRARMYAYIQHWLFHFGRKSAAMPRDPVKISWLAVPTDAPPELRAALVLVLALEAT